MFIPTTIMFTKAGCNDSSYEKAACCGSARCKRSCTSRVRTFHDERCDGTDNNATQSVCRLACPAPRLPSQETAIVRAYLRMPGRIEGTALTGTAQSQARQPLPIKPAKP